MKKFILGGIVGVLASLTLCMSASAVDTDYAVAPDFNNNKIIVTGTGYQSELITFQILKKGQSFDNIPADPNEYILWQGQASVGVNGTYEFTVPYSETIPAGMYKARIISNIRSGFAEKEIELVGTKTYKEALAAILSSAKIDDYVSLKAAIDGGDGEASPAALDISIFNKLKAGASELEGYADFVAADGSADFAEDKYFDSEAQKRRSDFFNTYVLIEALKKGNIISDMKAAIEQTSIKDNDAVLYKNLTDNISLDEQWAYLVKKLENGASDIKTIEALKQEIIEAFILSEARYADGMDIKNALITLGYGDDIGISNPSAVNSVYTALNGQDFADINSFKAAYQSAVNGLNNSGTTGSSGGSGGGSGSNIAVPPNYNNTNSETLAPIKVPFVDIEGMTWASEAIIALSDKNIINGKGDGYFLPNENITREEFVKILICASGLENREYAQNHFTDVASDDWFLSYVNIAYEAGYVKGINANEFGVGGLITRQDMAVMICNALKAKGVTLPAGELEFHDKDTIADYAAEAVTALYKMGVVNGMSDTEFQPLGNATRAQAAKIVYGVLKQLQ